MRCTSSNCFLLPCFFFISYFFGGYCIAFWAFLYLGRKINCATGATTTAVEEEEQAQTQRCIFGPEESLPHCKKILYNFQNCIHYKLYVLSYFKKGKIKLLLFSTLRTKYTFKMLDFLWQCTGTIVAAGSFLCGSEAFALIPSLWVCCFSAFLQLQHR